MAKLNLNLVLSNVRVNDVVVAGRMSIGSQLAVIKAPATLSSGWPVSTGSEPTPAMREAFADGDALRQRIGRSATSPCAAGYLPRPRSDHRVRTHLAIQQCLLLNARTMQASKR